ncbi:MAG: queuosine precursor transporter [Tannerella sp.]|jgi:uncharacterized integral membrane protein (TIGR00697 family)|nr:queuosine precursor transporter [Tannerella sp.]
MKEKVSIPFLVAGILFVVCIILANLLETKIIQIGAITATAGLMVFPISYIINDCIVEIWGYRKARFIIWISFGMNFFVAGLTQIAVLIPAASFWESEAAFNSIYGMAPRIVAGSFCAFLVGSFINAFVMSRMKIASSGRYFSLRAIVSTIAGESADSLIFFPIAFGGIIPLNSLSEMIVVQICLKSVYEIIILPVTVRVVKWIKRIDQTDAYDHNISFNPFKVKDI